MNVTTVDPAAPELVLGEPSLLHHDFVDHPLLTLESVAGLAETLPARSVEHNLGQIPSFLPGGRPPRSPDSVSALVRSPDVGGSWIALFNIEQDPAYAALLDEVLDAVSRSTGGPSTQRKRTGFIFLSAAGSVTPVHIDPEENILLQIRGTKEVAIGSYPSAREQGAEAERFHGGGHRNVDRVPSELRSMTLEPGSGVYIPLYSPHCVSVGPELSISLSATWRPAEVDRAKAVTRVNKWLRRFGATPRPPGLASWADHTKYAAAQVGAPFAQVARRVGLRSEGDKS